MKNSDLQTKESEFLAQLQSRLDLQYKITRILTESVADEAINETLRCICKYLDWPLGELWQVDSKGDEMIRIGCWNSEEADLHSFVSVSHDLRFLKGKGLPGRVWSSGRPEWITDVTKDLNFPRSKEALSGNLYSALGFPIVLENQLIGAMNFFSHRVEEPDDVLLTMMEITGRQIGLLLQKKLDQEAKRDLEARYRITADAASDAIFTINENSQITFANPTVNKIFGYSPEELTGKPLTKVMPERFRARHTTGIKRYIATGQKNIPWDSIELPGLHKQGHEVPLEISFGEYNEGSLHFFTGIARDKTERNRSDQTHRFLMEAGSTLSSSLDYETTLTKVSQLAVPFFADWCAVDLLEDGKLKRISVAHIDPAKVALAQALGEEYPTDLNANVGVPQVLRTGEPELVPEIPPQMLKDAAQDERHYRLITELSLGSYIIVPLRVRGAILGVIIFVRETTTSPFTNSDLTAANELSTRASIAVDNAKLYREAKEGAERLSLAMEATQLGTWYFNSSTQAVSWSDRSKEILGVEFEVEPTYELFYEIIHPEDRERVRQIVNQAVEPGGGGEINIEYRIVGPGGDLNRWAQSRGRAFSNITIRSEIVAGNYVPILTRSRKYDNWCEFGIWLISHLPQNLKPINFW